MSELRVEDVMAEEYRTRKHCAVCCETGWVPAYSAEEAVKTLSQDGWRRQENGDLLCPVHAGEEAKP
jgi:hypothetical protein